MTKGEQTWVKDSEDRDAERNKEKKDGMRSGKQA